MDTIRVLYILPSLNVCGGIESFAMNYFRNIGDEISIDFITHDCRDRELYDEITSAGRSVTVLPPFGLRTIGACLGGIKGFFADNSHYDIIHCHMANAAPFYFKEALKHGSPRLILHSHQDNYADKPLHALRNIPLIKRGIRLATDRAACTAQAGDFLFKGQSYHVITNAIAPELYRFDPQSRTAIRELLGIPDGAVLLGTVGRLTEQKNPAFLLRLLSELPDRFHLVYVGEGHLDMSLDTMTRKLGLGERVHFAGSTTKVSAYMSAMDIFLLPSIYEGLGIVNIEAQASGLYVLASDRVPKDADMGELFTRLPLEDIGLWKKKVLDTAKADPMDRSDQKWVKAIAEHGYDITVEAKKLVEYYRSIRRL